MITLLTVVRGSDEELLVIAVVGAVSALIYLLLLDLCAQYFRRATYLTIFMLMTGFLVACYGSPFTRVYGHWWGPRSYSEIAIVFVFLAFVIATAMRCNLDAGRDLRALGTIYGSMFLGWAFYCFLIYAIAALEQQYRWTWLPNIGLFLGFLVWPVILQPWVLKAEKKRQFAGNTGAIKTDHGVGLICLGIGIAPLILGGWIVALVLGIQHDIHQPGGRAYDIHVLFKMIYLEHLARLFSICHDVVLWHGGLGDDVFDGLTHAGGGGG